MDTLKAGLHTGQVRPQALRPLESRDVPQVAEIEREAFPTLWPPTPFQRELQNNLARYLVATHPGLWYPTHIGAKASEGQGRLGRWLRGVRRWLSHDPDLSRGPTELVSGFVGLWFIADEAHITGIAVRARYQGRGIGELLLLGAIELAVARRTREITLEVRVSNQVAQALYAKYNFAVQSVRKGYYSDNHEDAYVMTVDNLRSPEFAELLRERQEDFERRHGPVPRVLT